MKNRRTLKTLVIALAIALLVGVFVGISAFANGTTPADEELKIAYKNIDLDSTVRLAFAINKNAVGKYDSVKLVVTKEGTDTPIDLEYKLDENGDPTDELFVKEYEINGVAHYAYFTVGFAPKDFDTVITAYAVGVKDGADVAQGPAIRYSVVEYLLRQQEKNLDATRKELYASFLEYHEYAAKVLGTYTPTYLVHVNNGTTTTTRTYKAGEKVALLADTSTIVPGSVEAGFAIGWKNDDGKVVALGTSANLDAAFSGTVTPCYVAPTKNHQSDVYVLKRAFSDTALTDSANPDADYAVYEWADFTDGLSNSYTNLSGKAYVDFGSWSYDEALDAIVMNSGKKADKSTGFVHVSLTNPNIGATDASNVSVLEFDVTIPSRDYDKDGKYNEANGDFFYAGGVGTPIANIQVGFENNQYSLYQATEKLFTLTIYANTSMDGNTVSSWAIGSNANTADIAQDDDKKSINRFYSKDNVGKYQHYDLDTTYTVKLVYVPGTYDAENKTFAADSKTIGRIDIYVNNEYHHSRVFTTAPSTNTGSYGNIELGMISAAVTNASTPNRFNNSKRIGVALSSTGGSLGGEYYSNFKAYSTPTYAFERTDVSGTARDVYGITAYTKAEMIQYLTRDIAVTGGTFSDGTSTNLTEGSYIYGTELTLTAPATKDGKAFSYWATADGARVPGSSSNSASVTITVTADATYHPVYGASLLGSSATNLTGSVTINAAENQSGSRADSDGHFVLSGDSTGAQLAVGVGSSATRPLNSTTNTKYPVNNVLSIQSDGAKRVYISYDYTLVKEDIGTPTDDLKTDQIPDTDNYYLVKLGSNGIAGELIGDLFASNSTSTLRALIQVYNGSSMVTVTRVDYIVKDVDGDNVVDGFYLQFSQSDSVGKKALNNVLLPIGEPVALSYALNVDNTGNVTDIDVYANGEFVGNTGATPILTTKWNSKYFNVVHQRMNRFIGKVKLDNFSLLTEYRDADVSTTYDYDESDLPTAYNHKTGTTIITATEGDNTVAHYKH